MNLYGFVGNSPLSWIDRLGLDPVYSTNFGSVEEDYTFTVDGAPGQKPGTPKGRTSFAVAATITKDGCGILVTVNINFINRARLEGRFRGSEAYSRTTEAQMRAAIEKFKKGIADKWDGKFMICCDSIRAVNGRGSAHTFEGEKYCCCPVKFQIVEARDGAKVGVFNTSGLRYGNQYEWPADGTADTPNFTPEQIAGHEFGHFLGNIDEYGNGRNPTSGGRPYGPYGQDSPLDNDRGSSIMNDPTQAVQEHHLWRVLEKVNQSGNTKNCTVRKVE